MLETSDDFHSSDHAIHPPTPRTWAFVNSWGAEDDTITSARQLGELRGCQPISKPSWNLLRMVTAAITPAVALEVGTGVGISGSALLDGMASSGRLISIDVSPENQLAARGLFDSRGVDPQRYTFLCGPALDHMGDLADESIDLMLIDGDKRDYPALVDEAQRILRPRGILLVDNALWGGRVADPHHTDAETNAIKEALEKLNGSSHWCPALLAVGDGILMATRQ